MTYLRLCLVLMLVVAGCGGETGPEPADLVLLHGKIVTVDDDRPEAQALPAKGGVILAVSDADIEPYISDAGGIKINGDLRPEPSVEGPADARHAERGEPRESGFLEPHERSRRFRERPSFGSSRAHARQQRPVR